MTTSKLYEAGEFHVDVRVRPDGDGRQNLFALVHTKYDVIVGYSGSLAGAIRGAYALNEDLKDAVANPKSLHEEMASAMAPASPPFGSGFSRF